MPKITLNGWYRPWMPWVTGLLILGLTFAAALGATNKQVETNCDRIDHISGVVEEIRDDTAYTRGRIDAEFGKPD